MRVLGAGQTWLWAWAPALALLASAPAGAQTAAAVLARHPPPVVERLMRDKIVIVSDAKPESNAHSNGHGSMVRALVVFQQPRERALRLLSQTARQPEYRPELERVETVKRGDGTAVDEHQMKIMFMQIDYHVRTKYDYERSRISWEIDPSYQNDLQDLEGYWELYELDEKRTLARFGTRVNVGPALPVWIQDYATRKNVPETMERMRRWVDSNGTYRP